MSFFFHFLACGQNDNCLECDNSTHCRVCMKGSGEKNGYYLVDGTCYGECITLHRQTETDSRITWRIR